MLELAVLISYLSESLAFTVTFSQSVCLTLWIEILISLYIDDIWYSYQYINLYSQGEPGFQGTMGPRGKPGDGLPGEKV